MQPKLKCEEKNRKEKKKQFCCLKYHQSFEETPTSLITILNPLNRLTISHIFIKLTQISGCLIEKNFAPLEITKTDIRLKKL